MLGFKEELTTTCLKSKRGKYMSGQIDCWLPVFFAFNSGIGDEESDRNLMGPAGIATSVSGLLIIRKISPGQLRREFPQESTVSDSIQYPFRPGRAW